MAAYVAIAPLRANIALCAGEFLGDPDAFMAAKQIFEAIKDLEGVKVCDEVLTGLQQ